MTNEADAPPAELKSPKHWIIGDPLPTEHLEGQLLPKHLALPIFASDPLSSVAYAPQELVMILLVGGLAFLSFAPWVALAVIVLLVTVVASYRQLIRAYPSGGGDYEVAHRNLGEKAGLVVASALLVDYVMTVVVSVASGVDNIISAIPELNPFRVEIAIAFVIILAAVNLRGVSESTQGLRHSDLPLHRQRLRHDRRRPHPHVPRRSAGRRVGRLRRAGGVADAGGHHPAAPPVVRERMLRPHRRRGDLERRAGVPTARRSGTPS